MPSRLLREGILDSAAVDQLSLGAEVFYRRLMSVVDDFGRFDARPAVLRGRLYALRLDTVKEAEVAGWLEECERAGLVGLYAVNAKPYLLFKNLGQPRAKESKYPEPPDKSIPASPQLTSVNGCKQTHTDENSRVQMKTDAPYSYSGAGSYSGSNSGSGAGAGSTQARPPEPTAAAAPPAEGFDPLKADADSRKLFEQRWNTSGLRPIGRLSLYLQGRLKALLLAPQWANDYPAALERVGQIAWLRDGTGRRKGPYDVSEFLRDDEEVAKILRGVYDPRAPDPRAPPAGSLTQKAAAAFKEFLDNAPPDEQPP